MTKISGANIEHIHQSQRNYLVWCEDNFIILPDGKTIIGVENTNTLICEDITRNDSNGYVQIATHGSRIYTVFYNAVYKSIFVGELNGNVIEYKHNGSNLSWVKVTNYGNLGIGHIACIEKIGDVLVCGGYGFHLMRAIDFKNKILLPGAIKTGIKHIYSLKAFECAGNRVHLAVSGMSADYSGDQTDVYDVTPLATRFKYVYRDPRQKNGNGSANNFNLKAKGVDSEE
jgi:hypothetical protein